MAAQGLIELGAPGQAALPAITDFITELGEKDKGFRTAPTRLSVMKLLRRLTLTKKEVALLVDIARDREEADILVREEAVEVLGGAGTFARPAWVPLFSILQDEVQLYDQRIALKIVHALGQIEPPSEERSRLAKEVKRTFDGMLKRDWFSEKLRTDMRAEMEKTLKNIEGPKAKSR
jgi:hypothetical protein